MEEYYGFLHSGIIIHQGSKHLLRKAFLPLKPTKTTFSESTCNWSFRDIRHDVFVALFEECKRAFGRLEDRNQGHQILRLHVGSTPQHSTSTFEAPTAFRAGNQQQKQTYFVYRFCSGRFFLVVLTSLGILGTKKIWVSVFEAF